MEKLAKTIAFIDEWPLKTFTKLLTTRILKDADVLNLSSEELFESAS
jgi:hypothetical protein